MSILSLIFPCEVQYIFIILAIYISSLMNCLFTVFSYFSIGSLSYSYLFVEIFIHNGY